MNFNYINVYLYFINWCQSHHLEPLQCLFSNDCRSAFLQVNQTSFESIIYVLLTDG